MSYQDDHPENHNGSNNPRAVPAIAPAIPFAQGDVTPNAVTRRMAHYVGNTDAAAPSAQSTEEAATSFDLLGAIWRRRWWVVLTLLLALLGGALFYYQATPIYSSQARLFIFRDAPSIITAKDGTTYMPGSANNYLATQIEIMMSSSILRNVAEDPELQSAKSLSKEPITAAGEVAKAIDVRVADKSDVVVVSGKSTDPNDAALVVNSLVRAYTKHTNDNRRETARDILQIVTAEKEKQTTAINELYSNMVAFKRIHGDVDTLIASNRNGIVTTRLGEINNARIEVQLQLNEIKRLAEAVAKAGDDLDEVQRYMSAFPSVVAQLGIPGPDVNLMNQLNLGKSELLRRQIRQGSANTEIAALQKQIEITQAQVREAQIAAATQFAAALKQRVDWLSESEADLRQQYEAERQKNLDQSAQALEYERMRAELDRGNKNIDLLNDRIKELSVSSSEDTGNFSITVLENARPATKPVSPVASQIMAMAGVLGLMGGIGLALLRDWMDPRLNSLAELRNCVDAPVLGVIPHIDNGLARNRLEVVVAPKSPIAEAYRMIRTAVYFESPTTNAKIILVTSPQPGDGKSTLASNLSAALALAGKKTLLIDADCRKPVQNRAFQVKDNAGLSGILEKNQSFESVVQSSGLQHLDLIVCGEIPDAPSELLGSGRFDELLAWAAKRYDRVIIDSPPIVPVTDARIIAARCDQVLLVVRANRTSRNAIQFANQMIQRIGTPLIGVVVNDALRSNRNAYNYGYFGGYGKYYVYESKAALPASNN
jgi:polysaccharide biosynthesis transport protein